VPAKGSAKLMRIAIIGGGIGGLSLASRLAGHDVSLFEKGRGAGGRMATRRSDAFRFDHGAQCFTIRTDAFRQFLEPFQAQGLVAEWTGRVVNISAGQVTGERKWLERHFVGAPDMNAIPRALAKGVDFRPGIDVAPLDQHEAQHDLRTVEGEALGRFDLVVSTTTPHQTAALFGDRIPGDSSILRGTMKPCFALMVGFAGDVAPDWIAAKVMDGPIKWISVNSSKPGREAGMTSFVAHSRSGWAQEMLAVDPAETEAEMRAVFEAATGLRTSDAAVVTLHRWRSALVRNTEKAGPMFVPERGIAATGDWTATSRIEEVVLSAMALAEQIGKGTA